LVSKCAKLSSGRRCIDIRLSRELQSGDISNSSNDARSAGGVQQHNTAKKAKKSHNDQQQCSGTSVQQQCSGTVVDCETVVNAMARKTKDEVTKVKTVIVKNKVEFEEC